MDNHFHLLLQLPEPTALSRCVAGLLVAYWHYYRRRYALVGHLFLRIVQAVEQFNGQESRSRCERPSGH